MVSFDLFADCLVNAIEITMVFLQKLGIFVTDVSAVGLLCAVFLGQLLLHVSDVFGFRLFLWLGFLFFEFLA